MLNDFPGAGIPAKSVQYDLTSPTDIARIQILSGNAGRDGRIFSTTVINYSIDNGANFELLGYFQSDPSGTLNNESSDPRYGSTLVAIFDDLGSALLTGVTNLQFDFYAVDNTGGQMRDPFDGENPFTAIDDGLSAAFVSPLIYEIDVTAVPEPATLAMWSSVALLTGIMVWRRRQRT